MCLYTNIQDSCAHSECQIAVSIYKSSETFHQRGLNFPLHNKKQKSHSTHLPLKLQLHHEQEIVPEFHQEISPLLRRDTHRTFSSKSSQDPEKQTEGQVLKIMKRMQKQIKQLKKNQMMMILKMKGLQSQWEQMRKSTN